MINSKLDTNIRKNKVSGITFNGVLSAQKGIPEMLNKLIKEWMKSVHYVCVYVHTHTDFTVNDK